MLPSDCDGKPTSDQSVGPSDKARLPLYSATDLTQGGDLAQISLAGQVYTLRITRAGKLILTK
ncbi:hemin uptake protein HemP [Marivivens donghaensis]|uniref:Hemin uptake protein HemP n=1 Tax=Marivivens donghaensis TaxID=1699413 RepID=A0ABX0VY61_9RHOB|nr:hemin uptake protein HemP [Marivivens donghaensis]NIY73041.1 hemin uptake protein HemP [Marivivens donghaensis]